MLTIEFTPSFKRDYKRMMKKHYNETEFRKVINLLVNQEQEVLRTKYKDHATGKVLENYTYSQIGCLFIK